MAKQARNDRQAVIDSIRKQQKSSEQRRGYAIIAVSVVIALLIIGAAMWRPLSNALDRRAYAAQEIGDIGAPADACGEITTAKAAGNQDHVPQGTPLTYPDSPPAFGQHWDMWDTMERQIYTASDRPELGELVHNLEHGFTLLWYDETVADDEQMMDDLRGLASKFDDTDNLRNKFKVVPWTSEDGEPFPDGQHVAMTHWSVGGAGETDESKQVGVWQYCSEPSGAALEDFMEKYPYMDTPEPNAV